MKTTELRTDADRPRNFILVSFNDPCHAVVRERGAFPDDLRGFAMALKTSLH
jgi:hypothetical protein